jgi:opacity protein-like surface antigen
MKKASGYIFVFILAVFLSVCPLNSASAQVEAYQLGGYFGVWGAFTINPDLSSSYCDDDWHCYEDDVNLDIEETSVVGIKIGYNHPLFRALALEFEYGYLNPDISYRNTVVGDVKFNNFMFNIMARIPVGVIHPYWGVGFGFSNYDFSPKYAYGSRSKDNTSYAWQFLTGMEIDLAYNLAVDIGYRYFVTELDFGDGYESDNIDFTTSMATLGLKFRF